MKFGKVDHLLILGGSRCTAELALYMKQNSTMPFDLYTAPRQLQDVIYPDGTTFVEYLNKNQITFRVAEDINKDENFLASIKDNSLGIGLGEAWSFEKSVIERFNGKLLDLMGIRLPQYRGGAHYTWQILRGTRIGACNLQIINEDMVQGVFDSGRIVKFKEYLFPVTARIPNDYFEFAVEQEIPFIKEFIDEVQKGTDFQDFMLQENLSIYFPRLHTLRNAFINWNWSTIDIERMICAFDAPYAGATTSINGKLARLKNVRSETNDGPFHPFQNGLVYKIYNKALYVATLSGTLIVSDVNDEEGNSLLETIATGDRFHTPLEWIEKGLTDKIKY
jgi:methionyl-tRNA formyltransferase